MYARVISRRRASSEVRRANQARFNPDSVSVERCSALMNGLVSVLFVPIVSMRNERVNMTGQAPRLMLNHLRSRYDY